MSVLTRGTSTIDQVMTSTKTGLGADEIVYDESSNGAFLEYDPEVTPTLLAVIEAIATALDTEPTDLPPLQSYIDAEALSQLVASPGGNALSITFLYVGHHVTVFAEGSVEVSPSPRPDDLSV